MKLSELGEGTALILALGAISGDEESEETIKSLLSSDESERTSARLRWMPTITTKRDGAGSCASSDHAGRRRT
jgi:hypothetical protein